MSKKKGKAKPRAFVLDCSLTVAWFFEDETNAYAEAVEDSVIPRIGGQTHGAHQMSGL